MRPSPSPDTETIPVPTHTPTPWVLIPSSDDHGPFIVSGYGNDVCDLYVMSKPSEISTRNGGPSEPVKFVDADANAAFIVRAVNSHAALVEALRAVLRVADRKTVEFDMVRAALSLADESGE